MGFSLGEIRTDEIMNDITGIEKVTKLIELVYNDTLQPSAQQVGKLLRDVFTSLRLVATPFQGLAFIQNTIDRFLDKSMAGVKEENLVMPPGEVILKIYQEIQVYNPQSTHLNLFSNLMSRFIDKEKLNEAHPAFIIIIPQLCDDEIQILRFLKDKARELEQYSTYDQTTNRFGMRESIRNELPLEQLNYPANSHMYISHLYSLDLAGCWQIDQEPDMKEGKQIGSKIISRYQLTDFGQLFVKACLG